MALKTYAIPFGKKVEQVDLPEEKVIYDIHGNAATTKEDLKAETLAALRHPLGTKPLAELVKPGDKVTITASDLTRPVRSKEFLPVILNELNGAGVPDSDIILVVATGTHRAHTHAEDMEVYGEEVVRRITIKQHDCRADDLVDMGVTSHGTPILIDSAVAHADVVIVTGGVSLHPFAGFGGGRKGIMPGVSGLATVNHNHLLALTDDVGGGCNKSTICSHLLGNRVSEDMTEVCAKVNPAFLLNVVFTPDGDLHEVVAGHWQQAFEKGCADLLKMAAVHIQEQGDVVIASAGGAPKDTNLYQGTKAHMNADFAVKEGGILITALDCPDIKEPPIFSNWVSMKGSLLEMEKAVRADFSIPAFVAFKTRCIVSKCSAAYLVTRPENFEFVRSTGQIPVGSVAEAWQLAQEKLAEQGKKDYKIIVMSHAAATFPVVETK
jgi:lactate racemase